VGGIYFQSHPFYSSVHDSYRDVIRLKKKKINTEDYRYSSAIDYAGGKGLLEVMVV